MQYVRNLSDSVSTAWNSINPATLSGAIDVIVVEQADGTLMCSPFHVRFGKFALLRPYEKKVEFKVNGVQQDYAMKLGEGGEAFFVFETTDTIPQSMQTSPISSPAASPSLSPTPSIPIPPLNETELSALSLPTRTRTASILASNTAQQKNGLLTPLSASPEIYATRPKSGDWSSLTHRAQSDDILRQEARRPSVLHDPTRDESTDRGKNNSSPRLSDRSHSPPPLAPAEAIARAIALSRELSSVNIPSRVTESGDLMLDMTGFKNSEEDAIRAEIMARRVLSKELQGNYDIGALFGMDENGNLWIYSSEEAKEAAMKRVMASSSMNRSSPSIAADAASDPGYQSDDSAALAPLVGSRRRVGSDVGQTGQVGEMDGRQTPPASPGTVTAVGDPNRNYAKTLRLTSDQLKALDLQPGQNTMSFTVNRATCSAYMYLWKHDVPVVISDIDGTITKSDALGHVLNMIGRDWTHTGVAKLYSDIVANGYNIMYLTSRSVGQADSTRTYLNGILQGGYRLPRGPTILSPDRTMAALRREIYLRKPEVFKMATLRDIRNLYGPESHPFYAGFGNRLTDQISYRTVDVPRTRIFTINANAEVSLDLLSLNQLKLTYVNITEVVDHYFPPVSMLVKSGGEEYTDFKYWRDPVLELDELTDSDSDGGGGSGANAYRGRRTNRKQSYQEVEEEEEEEEDEDEEGYDDESEEDDLEEEDEEDDEYGEGSVLSGDYEGDEHMMQSVLTGASEEEAEEDDNGEEESEVSEEESEESEEGEEEGESQDEDEVHDEGGADDASHTVTVLAPEPGSGVSLTAGSPPSLAMAEDVGAEVITGVRHLSVDRRGSRQAGKSG